MKNTTKHSISEKPWEEKKLGASEKFARKVSPKREKEIQDSLGLQMISVRLQKELVDQLKALADEDGIGYQPLIRQILTRHVRSTLQNQKKLVR